MKKVLLLLFFSLLLSHQSDAQEISWKELDSLYYVAEEALVEHDYKNSIEAAVKLLKEAKEAGKPYFQYHAYNLLGMSYSDVKDTARTRKYYEKALEKALETENDTLIVWAYNNLGNVYSERKTDFKKGIAFYDKALEVANGFNDSMEVITPLINIGWTYLDFKKYDKAYPYLKKTERILGNKIDNLTKAQLANLWGVYYAAKNEEEKAKKNFEQALNIAEKDSLFIEATLAYKNYSDFLFEVGDHKNAYTALQKHNVYQDKIFEKEKIEQIEAANARFELNEYRKTLELAEREQAYKDQVIEKSRQMVYILIASAAILLIILIFLYKTNQKKKALIKELKQKNNELYDTKEEAIKLSNLKAQFFSTVSHELRTPLYGVVGLTSLLLEDKTIKKHEEDLKSLKFSADYLLALINDVLQMNKMESNLVKLEKTSFNLYSLMSSIVKSFEFTRLQNKNAIHLEIDKNIPKNLIGDSIRLSQILMNLTGNAMKFTEDGHIWLIARLKGQEGNTSSVYFEVRDDGFGIPKSKQQEIFEEFSQLKNANFNYQGTGLGLPIVKRLLKLFDSDIHVSSEEGVGSSFTFEIVFENGESEDCEVKQQEQNQANLLGKNILVVDDNRINRAVTKRILEKKGVVCGEAVDGEEAIEKVRAKYYDLILMDVNMPKMNGMEATKVIRGFNTDLPIIALTAVEIGEIREQIKASGMNDIIVKPYDIPQFFQTLMRNLGN